MIRFVGSLALTALLFSNVAQGATALEGNVIDADTGARISDATVTVPGGSAVKSDVLGGYRLQADGKVFARAPAYRAAEYDSAELAAQNGTIKLKPFVPKGLYLSIYGVGYRPLREAALHLAADKAINALVIDIKGDRGLIDYPSTIPLAVGSAARSVTTIPDLPALVRSLHEKGIYAIARIVVFKDEPLAAAHPDFAVKYQNGQVFRDREHLAWTDPFSVDVRNYNLAVAVEAAQAGFDEIQFDYLRFPDAPQRLKFAREANATSRVEAISGFLAEARRRLSPYNVYIAADFFGYVCWNLDDTGIGQTLAGIAASADYMSPMLYPSGFQFGIPGYTNPVIHPYQIVFMSMQRAQARLGISPKRFRPWLQAFKDYAFDRRPFDSDEVAEQIRAATDFGSDGWMLWNARNSYDGIGLADAGESAQPQPAAISPASLLSACW
jgi:hypothetical protein